MLGNQFVWLCLFCQKSLDRIRKRKQRVEGVVNISRKKVKSQFKLNLHPHPIIKNGHVEKSPKSDFPWILLQKLLAISKHIMN